MKQVVRLIAGGWLSIAGACDPKIVVGYLPSSGTGGDWLADGGSPPIVSDLGGAGAADDGGGANLAGVDSEAGVGNDAGRSAMGGDTNQAGTSEVAAAAGVGGGYAEAGAGNPIGGQSEPSGGRAVGGAIGEGGAGNPTGGQSEPSGGRAVGGAIGEGGAGNPTGGQSEPSGGRAVGGAIGEGGAGNTAGASGEAGVGNSAGIADTAGMGNQAGADHVGGNGGVSDEPPPIPWSAEHDDGTFEEWTGDGFGWRYETSGGTLELSNEQAKTGCCSLKAMIESTGQEEQALVGRYAQLWEGFYSAWFRLEADASTSSQVIMKLSSYEPYADRYDINLVRDGNDVFHVVLFEHRTRGNLSDPLSAPEVPRGEWFQIEAYFQVSPGGNGRVVVWQDGVMVVDTGNRETADTNHVVLAVGTVVAALSDQPSALFVDDVRIREGIYSN